MRIGLGLDHRSPASTEALLDVATHAVVDALCGAAALERSVAEGAEADGGEANGTSTPRGERALQIAVHRIERQNYQVVNLDVSLVAGAFPLKSHLPRLRERLAGLVHVGSASVAVKEVSAGGSPWPGAGEGIAAVVVALLDQIADVDALHASMRSGG